MFRVTTVLGLAGAVAFAVMIADFVAHPAGTQVLANAATKTETTALNAELGKTS